ncbi:hypothetical protein PVL29_022316 [Vitis rotundifolia]|uniref:Pentatricopeptide repeat-containing protein PNM1, mitochondrial n=1 Tax=Vitis rotundifolia TaxID=103349 RepID=A0AA38YVF6_VITRO|nr:hypothetical protein PVL29_022316 [Vitis rotundifolia]
MWRSSTPLTSLQLRRLLLRCFSSSSLSSSSSSSSSSSVQSYCLRPTLSLDPDCLSSPQRHFVSPSFPLSRRFSSQPNNSADDDHSQIAQSLSSELLKDPDSEPVLIIQRLQLSFSHITPSPPLILQTLNTSPDAGRTVLGFYEWLSSNPNFTHSDETVSFFVDYFGRRKDFKAIHEVLMDGRNFAGAKTLESAIDRLVRAGRATQVVSFFDRMEVDYGFRRDRESLTMVVSKLCEHGFASHAEKMVKNVANEIFPNETICDLLIKGWCVDGKLDEARRLAEEMHRGGFEIEKILVDMDVAGVPRNVETFNVLITNLCKIRKTEDAMKLFYRMGEWGCYPNETTFLVLTRSLYQAARVGEGDEMIDRMKSAGFGNALDKKAYYEFIKILCGIERIDHAMSLFSKMKEDGCKPGIKTYDLLMGKLCAHGRLDKANVLFNEAVNRGVPVEPKAYKLDPRFVKKPTVAKKEKKRETLPEKMARKRRRLRKIRLSFVKKPKRMRRTF